MQASSAAEPPLALLFGFAPSVSTWAIVSRRAKNAAFSSSAPRSSRVGSGFNFLRISVWPQVHVSSNAVVCVSGSCACSSSACSSNGPDDRGSAPAHSKRLTHFRFPSQQNCRSAMSACC